MDASYRLGLIVVAAAVALGAVAAPFVPARPPGRAAEDLADHPAPLGSFRLVERSDQAVTDADLADRVWIAAFTFTRCPASCPRISALLKDLQGQFARTGVRLVSVSVDPEHDTPRVLSAYGKRFGAEADRWWFLTGSQDVVYEFIGRFGLGVPEANPEGAKEGAEAIAHTQRLALVDRGNRVVGYFDSDDPGAVARLVAKARRLDRAWVLRLPTVNATLNASCAVLLIAGWSSIRRRRVRAHILCMGSALAVSAAFFASYLTYHFQVGSVSFRGVGLPRLVYLTVLMSHTVLATATVPLVLLTLARALRGRFAEHARIARVTFPIWLYVSITGVIVYVMLYQMPISTEAMLGGG